LVSLVDGVREVRDPENQGGKRKEEIRLKREVRDPISNSVYTNESNK